MDVRLRFEAAHSCLVISFQIHKSALNFFFRELKNKTNHIILSSIGAALLISCVHTVAESVEHQVIRLNTADYPSYVVAAAGDRIK